MIKKFVFIHIPKTAGTTFSSILSDNFDGVVKDDSKVWHCRTRHYEKFPIIYGHFLPNRYEHLNRPMITFVRDPVERVISDFQHFGHGMCLLGWAKERANLQHKYIGDLDRFDFVGVTDRFEDSVLMFEQWSGVEMPKWWRNRRMTKNKPLVSVEDRDYIRLLNDKDYEIYNESLRRINNGTRK